MGDVQFCFEFYVDSRKALIIEPLHCAIKKQQKTFLLTYS